MTEKDEAMVLRSVMTRGIDWFIRKTTSHYNDPDFTEEVLYEIDRRIGEGEIDQYSSTARSEIRDIIQKMWTDWSNTNESRQTDSELQKLMVNAGLNEASMSGWEHDQLAAGILGNYKILLQSTISKEQDYMTDIDAERLDRRSYIEGKKTAFESAMSVLEKLIREYMS